MNIPDDIKAVVKAAMVWGKQTDDIPSSSMTTCEIALSNAIFDLSPESLNILQG